MSDTGRFVKPKMNANLLGTPAESINACHELGLRVQERVSCGIAGAQTSVLLPLTVFEACFGGPSLPDAPDCALVPDMEGFIAADFDKDTDVDQSDFGVFQRCWSGTGKPADPACAE